MRSRRRSLLTSALGLLHLPPRTAALAALHQWLDNWSGIGLVVVGMERQGYRFSLRKYGNGDGAWVPQFNRGHVGGRVWQRQDAVEGNAAGGVGGGEAGGVGGGEVDVATV